VSRVSPAVLARREAEFEAARTAAEVAELQRRWLAEDAALDEAQSLAARQVDDLRARVAQLEQRLRREVAARCEVVDDLVAVLRDLFREKREEIERRFAEIEARQLRFHGTHEPGRSYKQNSMVVKKGGLWVALVDTVATPGNDASWQLAVKANEAAKTPGIA
jgi:hypothetical protein